MIRPKNAVLAVLVATALVGCSSGHGAASSSSDTVSVGVWVTADSANDLGKTVGISKLKLGSQRNQAKLLIDDINSRAGLAGHRISPVFHEIAAGDDPAQSAQQACDDFTQDHHVTFVVSVLGDSSQTLGRCLADRGVGLVDDGFQVDEAYASELKDHLFAPSAWSLDRLTSVQLNDLVSRGFFQTQGKVGVVLNDDDASKKVLNTVVLPGLAAAGVTDPVSVAVSAAEVLNPRGAVLKLRASGVTKVMTINYNPLTFMPAAEAQHYRPTYSLISTYAPGALLEAAAPKQQLAGAVGIGWSPAFDVDSAQHPEPVSPAETQCLRLMNSHQVDTSAPTTRALVLWMCDGFWFLKAAVDQAGDASYDGLVAGAHALTSYQSPVTWQVAVAAGRSDGVSAYRDLAYVSGCACFQYTSEVKTSS